MSVEWVAAIVFESNEKRINPATDIMIDDLVNTTIPIYTDLNLHPVKKKKDCEMERQYKKGIRLSMRKGLEAIIAKYENKMKEL
jgi:hypothetical protein